MSYKEALSLKGKLQFAEGQLFYRVAAPVCRLLSKWTSNTGTTRPRVDEMHLALLSVSPALCTAGPRFADPTWQAEPILIFTEGAWGEHCSSIGAIMFNPGHRPEAFGLKLSEFAISQMISKVGQTQIIGQAELLPVLGFQVGVGECDHQQKGYVVSGQRQRQDCLDKRLQSSIVVAGHNSQVRNPGCGDKIVPLVC